jgi:hypothetical protein
MSIYEDYFKQYREKREEYAHLEHEMNRIQDEVKTQLKNMRLRQVELGKELEHMRTVITHSIDQGIDPIHAALALPDYTYSNDIWKQHEMDTIGNLSLSNIPSITGLTMNSGLGMGSGLGSISGTAPHANIGAVGSVHPGYGAVPGHTNFGSLHTAGSSSTL